ncbi:MAG: hypothetical protein AAF318_08015 [Pseudomonadota bacterium]
MPKIWEISQAADSSDCGFFCAYIAAKIANGTYWQDIDTTEDDVYMFRNLHAGVNFDGPSPGPKQGYNGLNNLEEMCNILRKAGAPNYEQRFLANLKGPNAKDTDLLRWYTPPSSKDVTLIAITNHWVMLLEVLSNGRFVMYDSSCYAFEPHVNAFDPKRVKDHLHRHIRGVVTRPYATSVPRKASRPVPF